MSDTRLRQSSRATTLTPEEAEGLAREHLRTGDRVEALRVFHEHELRLIEVGTCEACEGTKGIEVETTRRFGSYSETTSDFVPCPTCNGSGKRYASGVGLAAWVGDGDARKALGQCCPKHDAAASADPPLWWGKACAENPLEPWVKGLSRYGQEAAIRAALVSSDAIHVSEVKAVKGAPLTDVLEAVVSQSAITVATLWLSLGLDHRVKASAEQVMRVETGWPFHLCYALTQWGSGAAEAGLAAIHVQASAVAGEPTVRNSIRTALTSWALGEPT